MSTVSSPPVATCTFKTDKRCTEIAVATISYGLNFSIVSLARCQTAAPILSDRPHQDRVAQRAKRLGPIPGTCWRPCSTSLSQKNQALISIIHSAKGLERPVVLLAELERRFSSEKQRQDLEKYLYIVCSRAIASDYFADEAAPPFTSRPICPVRGWH